VEHKAQVINLSLSGPADPLLGRLIDVALARGITVVGAYDRDVPGGGFPASHRGVLAVVDAGPSGGFTGVVSAPGRDIPTTEVDGHWNFVTGSSYSAAHVSGLVALVKELSPRTPSGSALVMVRPGANIDVCATLLRVSGPGDSACAHRQIAVSTLH
jgi:subtilisin family serine protease